jgi:CheY-like chemotaxis protein
MNTLLIVDDNQQNLYLLQVLLSANGFQVEVAANGAEALAKARHAPPSMIISDILMPVMDGFSLCRAWKVDERLKNIPFIFYTATYKDSKDEDFALSLGADRFIIKPVEPERFLALITETWTNYQAGKPVAPPPPAEEAEYYNEYNTVLIRKLEDKMLQLEEANRNLERDINERALLEAERLEMERRLLHAQKLESLGVLAGGIAHDFNNLLMAVIGNLDLSLQHLSPSSAARLYIDRALHATRRGADLARQMLAYSGKGRFIITRMDLSELVRENTNLFRTAVSRNVSMNLWLTHELSAIEAEPGQVQQVIMNLITNASEAIGEKAGVITLITGVEAFDTVYLSKSRLNEKPPAGRYVYVEVSDTGCGMDAETTRRLFDPFFTTKFAGRGLGMAVVLGVVQGHKGAIMVESVVGQGSTIRVLFPAVETLSPIGADDSVGFPGRADTTTLPRTVLVVDDEAVVREVCAKLVQHLGFQTITAADGEEGLRLFKDHADEIGCVLLDLTMPRMHGLSTFREMKRLRPDIPVILCSGYDELQATQHFPNEGLAGFLQKPYSLEDLKNKIESVLRGCGSVVA